MDMQETRLLGLGWDDEFPDELRKKCQEWSRELPELSCVEVPRCYRVTRKRVVDTSIHDDSCFPVGLCSSQLRSA